MTDVAGSTSTTLLRHDRMIAVNELRSALSSWIDRLTVLVFLAVALTALNLLLSHQSLVVVASVALVVSALAGAGAAGIVERRLDFHVYDGALAADALVRGVRRRYVLSIHVIACCIVTVGALVGRPATMLVASVGYVVGAGSCHAVRNVMLGGRFPRKPSLLRPIRLLLQRPSSGAIAAVLVVSPLFFGSLGPTSMAACMGVLGAVASFSLTISDHGTVRFMTISGYGPGHITLVHARPVLVLLALTIPVCLSLSYGLASIIIVGVGAAALAFMSARILAYRIYSKRIADIAVGTSAAVACLAGFAAPILAPLVVAVIFWHLHRRSGSATWMLT